LAEQKNTLVLGIGNILLRDEGVGIHVVRKLEEEHFSSADLMDGGTGGFHLLGYFQEYKSVIIIDASLDEFPAGHVRVLHPKYASDFPVQLSAHEIGLKDLMDSAFLLGNMPEISLITISVKGLPGNGNGIITRSQQGNSGSSSNDQRNCSLDSSTQYL
jgi:hydrogenase maturation protease